MGSKCPKCRTKYQEKNPDSNNKSFNLNKKQVKRNTKVFLLINNDT